VEKQAVTKNLPRTSLAMLVHAAALCAFAAAADRSTPADPSPGDRPTSTRISEEGETPLRIFIRSGPKTHGPGEHDYPRFLAEWTTLLTERGARVDGAARFPAASELANTDVLIIFAGDGGVVSAEERAVLEPYLRRGGGLVTLHDGMCSDDPDWFATIVGGAKQHGERNYSPGRVRLRFVDRTHPITKGLADFAIEDEAFFLLRTAPGIHVLATAALPSTQAGDIVPQMWTYERTLPEGQPYRSFVLLEGHHYASFSVPEFRTLILRGVAWTGKRPADALEPGKTGRLQNPKDR
jgi:type 1 glutamine amidotransferase